MVLLEKISRNDAFKEMIALEGGIQVIVDIAINIHINVKEIVKLGLTTLANLAFNSIANIGRIVAGNGVKAVELSMQTYADEPRLLENATCVLSNLMFGSDDNKLMIGQTCGDEIVHIIRMHAVDVKLFKMALRALGNLSYCDANIRWIVNHGAAAVIVKGMELNQKDEECLQLAVEVMGNFASLEEEGAEETISEVLYAEGAAKAIIDTMLQHDFNGALVRSGLDALANLANDQGTTEKMAVDLQVVQLVLKIMKTHDWDVELIEHAVPLLATITYTPACIPIIADLDGIPVLLGSMDAHSAHRAVLDAAQMALTNLAVNEKVRQTFKDMKGVRTLLNLMEKNAAHKEYVVEVLATLTRFCGNESLSTEIAEQGVPLVMKLIADYKDDPDFLTAACRLLGHLAFVTSNLRVIVQYSGISAVLTAMGAHPGHRALMVRCIQTVDNIAMASRENAQMVIEEGGREMITAVMSAYGDDDEIQRFGKSAVLSMSALENLARAQETSKKTAKGPVKKVEEEVVDPLAEFRHMLSAGSVLTVWTKGSSRTAHVLMSPDYRSIVWQDPKSNAKLGAIDLRSVSNVVAGPQEGHKKSRLALGSRAANPELCFSIVGDRASLDLEGAVKGDVLKWTNALRAVLQVAKSNPSQLLRG